MFKRPTCLRRTNKIKNICRPATADRLGHAKAKGVSRLPHTSEALIHYQENACAISGGRSGTVTGLKSSTSVFPCQYHSTIASNSFIHLPPTLYNVFLPILQFSPVSIIPPLLHTHSSIYHPRCIMFFSQSFSSPLSVSFHHCSILIHPSTTHAV